MANKETKKNLQTVESIEDEIKMRQEQVRQMKRTDSELELYHSVQDMNTEKENDKRIMKACYDYIAQHRALHKKNNNSYGNHLE